MTKLVPPPTASDADTLQPSVPRLSIHTIFQGEKLDQLKSNWTTWNQDILIALTLNGLDEYVDGTLPQPNASSEPRASANWRANDRLARGFILQYIDPQERDAISSATSAKDSWDALKTRHEKEGPVRQLQLLTESLKMTFSLQKPLPETAAAMHDLVKRAFAAGELTCDVITCLVFWRGLDSLPNLQSVVNHNIFMATKEKPYKLSDIMRLLEKEQRLGDSATSTSSTLSTAVVARANPSVPTCSNCKKQGHAMDYCIASGGGMAGKSLDESRRAQRKARKGKTTSTQPNKGKQVTMTYPDGRTFTTYIDDDDTTPDANSMICSLGRRR